MNRYIPIGALAALLLASPAQAQGPCLPRNSMLSQLEGEYGEKSLWSGLGSDGRMLEIMADPQGGTWTALVTLPPSSTNPGGLSCVVATGEMWQTPKKKEGPEL